MKALLAQQGLEETLKSECAFLDVLPNADRERLEVKPHSTIVLCLGDKFLHEVVKKDIANKI